MEQEEEVEPGSSVQNQNLHDLQNYLVTFKSEIVNSDDVVLTNIAVDSSDVSDLYPESTNHDLPDPADAEEVSNQFSSGFYSEQGMLGTTLSDEATQQQMHNLVSPPSKQGGLVDVAEMNSCKDNETDNVNSIDLNSMHAQMEVVGYTDSQLNQSLQGLQSGSAQGIIMTSLDDSLDPTNGKMIQIVSLGGEDGQYLSLGDGQQMQILSSEDLGLTSAGSLVENLDTTVDLNTSSTATVLNSSNTPMALVSLSGNGLTAADITSNNSGGNENLGGSGGSGAISIVPAADVKREMDGPTVGGQISAVSATASSGSVINEGANAVFSTVGGMPQLVALSSAGDGGQPQLFAIQRPGFSGDSLQMSNLLGGNTEAMNTITIMPSELMQTNSGGGDMNYVLVLSQPDGQGADLKVDSNELGEGMLDENGMAKNMLRLIPKKFVNDLQQPLVCDYCNYTSNKRYLLTRHMKSHSEERPFKCDDCHRGFKTPASLLNHVNTHTGTRPHKCKTCDSAFTTSGELVRHIRYRHTFEKPHRCPECDYASVELSKLKRHMRSHTGERPYKCPNCPYASPDTYKLKRHMRIHTGEKPYQCDVCYARFTQSNSLKAHKLIHTGNKPVYQCSICPTTCGRKTDLKIHFNKLHSVGSPLDCKKCGKAFSDRYSYKQHIRTHDLDNKNFKCDKGDFVAATEKGLDIHHGKKYHCDLCQMTFILKPLLDKHMANVHAIFRNKPSSRSTTADEKTRDGEGSGSSISRFQRSVLSGNSSSRFDLSADLPSESEEGSSSTSLLGCAPSRSDNLHKTLIQDMKEGKLGDGPQVVIVHPDGSSQQISKLMGDKWTIEELFCSATNNGQTVGVTDEGDNNIKLREDSSSGSQQEKTNLDRDDGVGQMGEDPSSSSLSEDPSGGISSRGGSDNTSTTANSLLQSTIDQMNESTILSEESHSGMAQLCEASTQAEIESDTDSSGETPEHSNINSMMDVGISTSRQFSSTMEEASSRKSQNSRLGTGSTSNQDLFKINTPASASLLSTEQTAIIHSSSSLNMKNSKSNNTNSYLKSLIMQRPIVIKAPPNSSLASSSLLSSPLSSPSTKKLTSLLQLPHNRTTTSIDTTTTKTAKATAISNNPNLIVKQNPDGQQYSLLKHLNFKPPPPASLSSSSSSSRSSSSPPHLSPSTVSFVSQSNSISTIEASSNTSQLISFSTATCNESTKNVSTDSTTIDLFSKTESLQISTTLSSTSLQINVNDTDNAFESPLAVTVNDDNNSNIRQSVKSTASITSTTLGNRGDGNTSNINKNIDLKDSEKSEWNLDRSASASSPVQTSNKVSDDTNSSSSSPPHQSSQLSQPIKVIDNINMKRDQITVDEYGNNSGKPTSNQPAAATDNKCKRSNTASSTSMTTGEKVEIGLTDSRFHRVMDNTESEHSKIDVNISEENDKGESVNSINDKRKEFCGNSVSESTNVVDSEGTVWTLVGNGNVDLDGQGMDTSTNTNITSWEEENSYKKTDEDKNCVGAITSNVSVTGISDECESASTSVINGIKKGVEAASSLLESSRSEQTCEGDSLSEMKILKSAPSTPLPSLILAASLAGLSSSSPSTAGTSTDLKSESDNAESFKIVPPPQPSSPQSSTKPPKTSPMTGKRGKSGKRHADMDQSLVVPGKRVRKALVKISL